MTLVKCLECSSEQDYEEAVGYCEKCGHKLPVPHKRGKDTARRQLMTERATSNVGSANVAVTVGAFVPAPRLWSRSRHWSFVASSDSHTSA